MALEPELLDGAPLRYAPTNELGVVFLFSHLSARMQLHIESIRAGFPDCIARQRIGGKERRIRIEFEFRSSNYRAHGHSLNGCDWIVCWEHDWPGVPAEIKVVELRRYFGRGFNVWAIATQPQDKWPARGKQPFGKPVAKGDLVLFYEAAPRQWIQQIYTVTGDASVEEHPDPDRKRRKHRFVYPIRRICALDPPLRTKTLETTTLMPVKEAIFNGQHNRRLTEQWWLLYELLARKYPAVISKLEPFAPSRV